MFSILTNELMESALSQTEKIVFAKLCALSAASGYCFPSNKSLAKAVRKSERTVSRSLSVLAKHKFLRFDVVRFAYGTRRRIYPQYSKENLPESKPSATKRRAATSASNLHTASKQQESRSTCVAAEHSAKSHVKNDRLDQNLWTENKKPTFKAQSKGQLSATANVDAETTSDNVKIGCDLQDKSQTSFSANLSRNLSEKSTRVQSQNVNLQQIELLAQCGAQRKVAKELDKHFAGNVLFCAASKSADGEQNAVAEGNRIGLKTDGAKAANQGGQTSFCHTPKMARGDRQKWREGVDKNGEYGNKRMVKKDGIYQKSQPSRCLIGGRDMYRRPYTEEQLNSLFTKLD